MGGIIYPTHLSTIMNKIRIQSAIIKSSGVSGYPLSKKKINGKLHYLIRSMQADAEVDQWLSAIDVRIYYEWATPWI